MEIILSIRYNACMTEPTNDLIYEVLKKLQADTAEIKAILVDHSRQFLRGREDMASIRDGCLRS